MYKTLDNDMTYNLIILDTGHHIGTIRTKSESPVSPDYQIEQPICSENEPLVDLPDDITPVSAYYLKEMPNTAKRQAQPSLGFRVISNGLNRRGKKNLEYISLNIKTW